MASKGKKVSHIGSASRKERGAAPTVPPKEMATTVTGDDPGYLLVRKLFQKAGQLGMSQEDLGAELGLSAGYISHIRMGRAEPTGFNRHTLERIASFLEIPVIAAMMLAEQVRPEDFAPPDKAIEQEIIRCLEFMEKDASWMGFLPKSVFHQPLDMQLFAIWSYEQATGTTILSNMVDLDRLINEIQAEKSGKKVTKKAAKKTGKKAAKKKKKAVKS